jgi:hypothetical protein
MEPLRVLDETLLEFEVWLQDTVPTGLYSPEGDPVRPLADPVPRQGSAVRFEIESGRLTPEQASELVAAFSRYVAKTKTWILRVLERSPQDIANRNGVPAMLLVTGLAVGALLYCARK